MKRIICMIIIILDIFQISCKAEEMQIFAKEYIAYERNTTNILLGKNISNRMPMASTTKIMTAILVLEYGNLRERVIISENAQNINGQQLNLKKGDVLILEDLLYAILIYSANDGAIAIAEHIGGNVENFCIMMNEKAKSIGAFNTNFTSPHGLDDINHYSTPYDLAIITDYALDIPDFSNIVSKKSFTISINGYSKNINNTNKLLHEMEGINGVKTGFTNEARYCLVSNVKKDNKDIIVVLLGAETSQQRFNESKRILEYCLNNYEIVNLKHFVKNKLNIKINKSSLDNIEIICKNHDNVCILKDDFKNIKVQYYILENLTAPIRKEDNLAIANIYIRNKKIGVIGYSLIDNVNRNNYDYYFKFIVKNLSNFMKMK